MEIVAVPVTEAVVSKVTENLVDSVWRQIAYVWNHKSNIKDLKYAVDQLKDEKTAMEHRVEAARRNGEEIEESVKNWQTIVEETIKVAQKILDDNEKANMTCCFIGCFSNLKRRHQLSRKAKKEIVEIDKVRQGGKFEIISYLRPLPGIRSDKDYKAFESRRVVLEEIMEAIKGTDVSLIGVYGMSGVGKTTLAKKVAEQVKEDGNIKVVAFAEVTKNVDVRRIQRDIAEWLGLQFDVESIGVRAARLCERLKQEEKFLIILDDIWEKLKLEDIGIPFGNDHKGGKILMTSCSLKVLKPMDVQRHFQLLELQLEEAWHLFEEKAGDVEDPDLKPMATQVANRCAGLPILIMAVAKALKGKGLHAWSDALLRLKRSDNDEFEPRVNSGLEICYNELKKDEEKSLFRLCGQLAPQSILIRDLLKYCMGLGLFNQINTVKQSRDRLLTLLHSLKSSCLLLEGEDDHHVRMHDVIHRFALSVASKDHNVFNIAYHSVLEEWPEEVIFRQFTAVSLTIAKIPELPQELDCPNLQSFILRSKDPSLKIPDSLFNKMKKLKVLDLSFMHLSTMPLSIKSLENLQTLCLDHCVCEDIAVIGELQKLQVLSLINSSNDQLPTEVGKLTRLRLLDLSRCQRLEVIPVGVLSCLTQLEDLYMGDSLVKWENEERGGQRSNASLDELKLLKKLVTLELHIIDAEKLPENLFSEKLERFRIFIGEDWDWSGKYVMSRTLKLKVNRSTELERVKVLLKRSEDLYLEDLKGVKNVLYELDWQGFPQLKHLHLQNSQEIQCIVDCLRMGNFIAFPRLDSLLLDNLSNLEKICYNQLREGSFSKLRKLNVRNCNALKNLFSFSMFRSLAHLDEIDVNSCRIMEGIVAEGEGDKDEVLECMKLRSLTLEHLPGFSSFCSQVKVEEQATATAGCSQVTIENHSETLGLLFSKKTQFPGLTDLKLSSISIEKIWSTRLMETSASIQNLTSLIVDDCGNLSYLFTNFMVKNFTHLKKLEISNCNFMEEVIVAQELEDGMESKIFPKLDFLKLKCLPMFIRFCTSNLLECPSLKVLWIESCPLLQTFISPPMSNNGAGQGRAALFDEKVSFPDLEELHIIYMHKLKMIWFDKLQADSFGKLKVLKVKYGNELLKIFPSEMWRRFHAVEELEILNCVLLEEVFNLQAIVGVQETRHVAAASQLRSLFIHNLPNLTNVWNGDPDGILTFHNLRFVKVWQCPSLKSLFPFSIAEGLKQLESLHLSRCGVQEVVARKEGGKGIPKFVFPRLKILVLYILEELKCFYASEHTIACRLLKKLTIFKCEKLGIFTSGAEAKEQQENPQNMQVVKPLFPFRKIIHNLEELALDYKDIMMIQHGQFPVELFHKLKVLNLQHFGDDSTIFPFDLLQKFKNLRRLVLTSCYFEVLLPNGINVGENARILSQIQGLILNTLPNLRYLWNPGCQLSEVLQNLKTLTTRWCDSLINLAPSSASFHNVTTLEVWRCNGLVKLVSSSTAKSMVNLTKMSVRECNAVTEIVASEGDDLQFQTEIVFNKLATLTLHCLRSLASFLSSESYIIKFPSLEEVSVSQCPKMKIFSQGGLSAPKLKRVYLTQERDEWRWIGDLNTTIKQLHTGMIGFRGLQYLELSKFPELKEVWHGQLPVNFFFSLSTLVVDECEFSSSSVPSDLLPCLNNLEKLEVKNCSKVEQVFGLARPDASGVAGYLSKLNKLQLTDLPRLRLVWNEVPKGSFDFKNLKILKVHSCSKLRYVFTPSMCLGLVQLQELEVKSCDVMAEIINEGLAMEETNKEVLFPLLNSIILESLPRLINFSSGSSVVQCPSLKEIRIVDCPTAFTCTFLGEAEANATHGIIEPEVCSPNLKDLKLSSVDVEKLWHSRQMEMSSSFRNLISLTVDCCGNLKYLLSSSLVKSVVHLRRLEISDCKMIKQIMVMDGLKEETKNRILLPQLHFLKLKDLPELTQFCTSDLIECPVLKELWIQNCPQMLNFVSSSASANIYDTSELEINSALFDEKVVFPNLEELQILNMDNLKMIWSSQLQSDSFGKVKVLKMEQSEKLLKIYPSGMLRSLRNLEDLIIKKCSTLEVVFDLKEVTNIKEKVASQLRKLVMEDLPNLKHVWNEDRLGLVSFDKLSSVYVSQCDSLITLAPSSACFQSLTTLDLVKCNKLESLVASSTAKSLIQLTEMSIKECDGMKEILTNEGDEPNEEIIFSRLRSLKLQCLPSLLSFCSSVHCFKFPFLTQVIVRQCPKMQVFSRGSVITPKLQSVQQLTEDKTDKERWSGNLNATIQQLFIDMVDDEVERR
eukprot:XP_015582379.1 uncharacterized protein LOC8285801 [Ricinus communis]